MNLIKKILFFCFAGCVSILFAQTSKIDTEGNELLKKIDRNLTPVSFESYRKLINIEPDGKKKEFVLYTAKKGNDKMVTTFLSPKTEVGRSTLRLGDNMWLYIPNVGKPVRITSMQSVTGGIFNNSDIMRLDYSEEYDCVKLDKSSEEYVMTLKAKTGNVAYDKLLFKVDVKNSVPTQIECYTASDMLIKTLYFKEIKTMSEGIKRPAVIETDSPLHEGYRSVMVYSKMKIREFPDEVFTMQYMPKIPDLRN
ncbi:outer membrane lipoprotein-sorting protein [candidate division WOR-3 bacterium]|nr:outer membrane lipoprotein-sorting protein [candidate division WOR-3 bacterium]MCK4527125.1 outer membrane lipoprotein-sorting protein [candidate division WOR-3 bacterium]